MEEGSRGPRMCERFQTIYTKIEIIIEVEVKNKYKKNV